MSKPSRSCLWRASAWSSGVREEDRNDIDVVPGQVKGLGQVLKFISKKRTVGGKRPKMTLNLCEVGHGKWNVYQDSILGPGHLSEGKDRDWRLGCLGMSE